MKFKANNKIIILSTIIFILIIIIFILLINQTKTLEINGNDEHISFGEKEQEQEIFRPPASFKDINIEPVEIDLDDDIYEFSNYSDFKNNIKNSDQLIVYLNTYFSINHEDESLIVKDLEGFFNNKAGSSFDFAYFIADVLNDFELRPGIIRYDYKEGQETLSEAIVVFRKENQAAYLSFSNSEILLFHHGSSFREIIQTEEARLQRKIDRYSYFPSQVSNFSEPQAPFEWIDL